MNFKAIVVSIAFLIPIVASAADSCGSFQNQWMACKQTTDCRVIADECGWLRSTVNAASVDAATKYYTCRKATATCSAPTSISKTAPPFKCHEGLCLRLGDVVSEALRKNDRALLESTLKEAGSVDFPLSHIHETALTLAALNGLNDFAGLLLQKGAKVNHKTTNGYTALMMAVRAKEHSKETIETLLKAGADKTLRNRDGQTALDLAVAAKNQDAIKLLK